MQDFVDQAKQGDLQAFSALVEQYERTVFAAVLAIVRDRHLAEDITQEVFVEAFQKLRSLREATSFPFWLLKIARREAIRCVRKQRRQSVLPIELNEEPGSSSPDPILNQEDRNYLLQQICKLPEHEQLMISLRYFDGHSVREIAERTGRPVGTVTKRISRAIERLKNACKQEETR